jgi:hypothetical protein
LGKQYILNKLSVIFVLISVMSLPINAKIICKQDGKLKYIYNNKEVIEKSSYCWDDAGIYMMDYNCHKLGDKCSNIADKSLKLKKELLDGKVGTPSFKVCHVMRGRPQITWFYDGKSWFEKSICRFGNKQFIGAGYYMSLFSFI